MPDSVLAGGIGAETTLQGACAVINKLMRLGVITVAIVQAASDVEDLIARVYANLVTSTTQKYSAESRALVRLFEQYMQQGKKAGLFGADAAAIATTIAALTTVNTAAATTDLRYLFSSKITLSGFDAASEADANTTQNYSYETTG